MKVVVYAISKNEEQHVNRWMSSMSEADQVIVLDTGSTDGTIELLRSLGAIVVQKEIRPWRFDVARNQSLELVPEDTDICVCTDLDEAFQSGWRAALEDTWKPGMGQARYQYVWSHTLDGGDGLTYWYDKIHSRHGYQWKHPVHEVLEWVDDGVPGPTIEVSGIRLDHYPDFAKSRAQYLPLLELSVQEDPDDDRNLHYLGREYLYRGRLEDCIATLKRHLSMPSATWKDERAASMRYISKAYLEMGNRDAAYVWGLKAVAEAPHLREPWMDLGLFLYAEKDWDGVLYCTACALKLTERPMSYICEAQAWGSLPHDMRCIALYRMGCVKESLEEARKALILDPQNTRLQKNVTLLEKITV